MSGQVIPLEMFSITESKFITYHYPSAKGLQCTQWFRRGEDDTQLNLEYTTNSLKPTVPWRGETPCLEPLDVSHMMFRTLSSIRDRVTLEVSTIRDTPVLSYICTQNTSVGGHNQTQILGEYMVI